MSLLERSELQSALYKQQADLAVQIQKCKTLNLLLLCALLTRAHDAVTEALEEFRPEPQPLRR